jgi:hypothetical protein
MHHPAGDAKELSAHMAVPLVSRVSHGEAIGGAILYKFNQLTKSFD